MVTLSVGEREGPEAGKTSSDQKKNTPCAWAGETFFPVVVLCQCLVLVGNRFWFLQVAVEC
jgi:hypothetical protein